MSESNIENGLVEKSTGRKIVSPLDYVREEVSKKGLSKTADKLKNGQQAISQYPFQ